MGCVCLFGQAFAFRRKNSRFSYTFILKFSKGYVYVFAFLEKQMVFNDDLLAFLKKCFSTYICPLFLSTGTFTTIHLEITEEKPFLVVSTVRTDKMRILSAFGNPANLPKSCAFSTLPALKGKFTLCFAS